jgi:ribosomal protein L37E
MEQILEYSFARVLVRLAGVLLAVVGFYSFGAAVLWLIGTLVLETSPGIGYALSYALSSGLPSLALALLGAYFARDGHLLARIVTSGLHGRCRKCGYDTRAVTAGACPECGTPLPAPSTRSRTPADEVHT